MSEMREEALNIAQRFEMSLHVLNVVSSIANNENEPSATRASAIQILVNHNEQLPNSLFALLTNLVADKKTSVLLGRQAAKALGSIRLQLLSETHLNAFIEAVEEARSAHLSSLVKPFARGRDPNLSGAAAIDDEAWVRLGNKLAVALEKNPGIELLQTGQREAIIKAFAVEGDRGHAALASVLQRESSESKEREATIEKLLEGLTTGNASRGRVLFHDQRVSCGACHRIQEWGGQLGPNLTKIGNIRQPRDLIEAVLFPSATVVNGYEHYVLQTLGGEVHGGIIQRETKDAIYLKNVNMRNVRVSRSQISGVTTSPVSVMPAGLDQLLSRQELLDLIAFLQTCR